MTEQIVKCLVCEDTHKVSEPPKYYVCPVCRENMSRHSEALADKMKEVENEA